MDKNLANLVLIGQKYYPGFNVLIVGSDIPDRFGTGSPRSSLIKSDWVMNHDINTILSLIEGPSVAGGIGDSKNGPRSDIIEL